MKSRFTLFAFSVFVLVSVMGLASADVVFTNVSGNGASVDQGNTATISFNLFENATGGGDATGVDFTLPLTLTSGSNTFNSAGSVTGVTTPFTLLQDTTSTTISLTFTVPSTQPTGTYTGTLQPTGTYTATFEPLAITLTVTSNDPAEILTCNTLGNPGDLRVKGIDLRNDGMTHKEFGDDDQWFPLDEIEVEIEVKNDGNDDVDDIEVEWGLWDTKANDWAIDPNDEKDFNLKDGKDEILTVNFQLEDDLDVDLEDIDDGENYRFYAIATGTVDSPTSPATCASDFEPVEIVIEKDFVALNDIRIPETVQCSETVEVTADVWNIGDSDQDEVSVEITSLGGDIDLRESVLIGDINAFDNEPMAFTFEVPRDTKDGVYTLVLSAIDEDGDVYENDFDDDPSEFNVALRVEGCSDVGTSPDTTISATLESGGKAGEQLVVRGTIVNNENELKTFTVSAAGFTTWASSATADQTSVVLGAGESRDVRFTFDVLKDAFGTQTFFIEALSGNEVTRQPVSVTIESKSGFALEGNLPLLIGLINIILVIIIIIVAVRVARR